MFDVFLPVQLGGIAHEMMLPGLCLIGYRDSSDSSEKFNG